MPPPRRGLSVASLALSVSAHLLVGGVLVALLLWAEWTSPRVHVVNLVPAVAALGAPTGNPAPPAPTPPVPPPPAPPAPRAAAPAPPEPPRPAPAPPRPVAEPSAPARPRQALSLPGAPPRATQLPPRPPALPRPGEKELPAIARAPRPAPAPAPGPAQTADPRPPAAVPLGQARGSTTGSGALSLDVSDFPHAWYLRQVLRKVEEQWQRQGLAPEPPEKPMVMVEIQRNGTIQVPRIEKTSGNAYYDQAALRAIMDASPFPELPTDWPRPVLRVMFRFDVRQG